MVNMANQFDPSIYGPMIKKLSINCLRKLPKESYLSLEDLEQEGWIVFIKLKRKRFKPELKTKFGTLLYLSLINRYKNIVRDSYKPKRHAILQEINESIIDETIDQDKLLKRKETIKKIKNINKGLADLLNNGVSQELYYYAKHQAKIKAARNNRKIGAIKFTRGMIEDFFGIKIHKILKIIQTEI